MLASQGQRAEDSAPKPVVVVSVFNPTSCFDTAYPQVVWGTDKRLALSAAKRLMNSTTPQVSIGHFARNQRERAVSRHGIMLVAGKRSR